MDNNYTIRQETSDDYAALYQLIKTAFKTAKVSDGDEQDFSVNLRNSTNYLPELALVAEHNGQLIGHIMFTKTVITTADKPFTVLLLAPLSVLLEYRNHKVGAALIKAGFKRAKAMGYSAVFLCGDPAYYARFGFKKTSSFGIHNVNDIPEVYALACELTPNALSNIEGTIDFLA